MMTCVRSGGERKGSRRAVKLKEEATLKQVMFVCKKIPATLRWQRVCTNIWEQELSESASSGLEASQVDPRGDGWELIDIETSKPLAILNLKTTMQ